MYVHTYLAIRSPPRSPSFLDGLRFICSQRILLRIILISALTGLLNGGLSASITLLAKSKHGFSMNQAQVGGSVPCN